MLTKIKLSYQINEFYSIFGEVLHYKLTVKPSTLKDKDILSQILYDITEALEGYDDNDETDEMFIWLTKLFRNIATLREKPQHNYTVAITILFAVTAFVAGYIFSTESHKSTAPQPQVESTQYTAYGRYYTNGTVITNDGNEWSFSTDTISDKTPTNHMPVWIAFDDNATPNDITDDTILGLVYDRHTAIYDELETTLSDSFELEREGNNIHIKEVK